MGALGSEVRVLYWRIGNGGSNLFLGEIGLEQ